ncbi:AGAP004947-PA-like protein [Anopheles sinensis]|uniref:AGAP004947-PA-like protein n=1 Tax=Anopheles sinensis TaxID=74873 RepID=A0A084WD15_ANOSI|nr:AGAP004947-PA-like protein [Anopheles sinensis]
MPEVGEGSGTVRTQRLEKQAFLGLKLVETVSDRIVSLPCTVKLTCHVKTICSFPVLRLVRGAAGNRARCAACAAGRRGVAKICCLICAATHIRGFLHHQEPFPHEMLFCGLYASYFLISCYAFLFLYRGCCALCYTVEAVLSGVGFLLFVVSAFVSMYHAEQDIHLQYLSDEEEWYHQFFVYCRLQSLTATITAQVFLVHCSLALDLAGLLDRWFGRLGSRTSVVGEEVAGTLDEQAAGRLQINPFWMPVWNAVWVRLPCGCAKDEVAE